jgi:hypothetical protein
MRILEGEYERYQDVRWVCVVPWEDQIHFDHVSLRQELEPAELEGEKPTIKAANLVAKSAHVAAG